MLIKVWSLQAFQENPYLSVSIAMQAYDINQI